MNKKITLEEILKMDVKSDEFWQIYKTIDDKYWTFENPDEFQKAAQALHMFATRFEEDKVILCCKMAEQIVSMHTKKSTAATGHLVFQNQQYYFDIYESEPSKDKMQSMLGKASKAFESGNIAVKTKKDKYGKKYFKNKSSKNE